LQFVLYFLLSGKGNKKEEHLLPQNILLNSFTVNSKKWRWSKYKIQYT